MTLFFADLVFRMHFFFLLRLYFAQIWAQREVISAWGGATLRAMCNVCECSDASADECIDSDSDSSS